MILQKKSVRVSRVDCSKLMVLDRRRPNNQKTLGEQKLKMKESSVSRRMELARENIHLDEIREIGRGLVVQRFKGKNNHFVLNVGFDRKPV